MARWPNYYITENIVVIFVKSELVNSQSSETILHFVYWMNIFLSDVVNFLQTFLKKKSEINWKLVNYYSQSTVKYPQSKYTYQVQWHIICILRSRWFLQDFQRIGISRAIFTLFFFYLGERLCQQCNLLSWIQKMTGGWTNWPMDRDLHWPFSLGTCLVLHQPSSTPIIYSTCFLVKLISIQ